jgi:hypothetical protein
MRKILLVGVAALLMGTSAAQATQTWCAVVLKNSDGWLALRERPDWRSKMITKLREGDYLSVGSEQCWKACATLTSESGRILRASPEWTAQKAPLRLDGFVGNIFKSSCALRIRRPKLRRKTYAQKTLF